MQVALEVGEVAFRVVREERVGRDSAGGLDDLADCLHRQERLRILRHESHASGLEQFASDLVFHRRLVVRCGFQWLPAEDPLVEGEPVLDFVGFGVNRHPESFAR